MLVDETLSYLLITVASHYWFLILNIYELFVFFLNSFKVVKSHTGLQETHFSLMMGVNTRLISSRINIKMQRVSHMNHFMANISHVNKYEALSNDLLSAAWVMWVQTNGFGAVLVKPEEQVGPLSSACILTGTRPRGASHNTSVFCSLWHRVVCLRDTRRERECRNPLMFKFD